MSYNKLKSLVANVEAIETAMKIQVQGRQATAEEKEILSRYSGFGGIKEVLNIGTDKPIGGDMQEPIQRLQELINAYPHFTEPMRHNVIEGIKASVLTAFYTPKFLVDAVVRQIHATFSENGLKMRSFLEPSAGIGGFLPIAMSGTYDYAIEKDLISGMNALARTRELESAYRTIAFFYKNTESDKVKNVTIVNATMEQLQDLDNTIFADHISNELKQNFDRLDLRRNYSLLVVPGYIGSNAILDKWSKMAYENKVFLVTDFQDLETPDDVVDIFFNANHTSGDVFKSNTIMTCNWLLGRQREESVGEEENLYIPPSSSLAGKIYNTLMSQVVAGKKFGGLNEVESVRFDLRKSEISELERMGLVPMVNEYSKVMAFSAKTLFNGDNLGLQTYSVVRVFDYITKVLIDFLNRRAFENWTTRTEADLRGQVVKFLDSVMGPNKLIERFKVMKIEQDPNQKDRVLLDIHITPYFPAKSFVIQLAGHKGDNPEDAIWESEYHQE